MRIWPGLAALLLIGAAPADDATRALADLRAFAATSGEALWPGYGTAPFGFLAIEGERERLICDTRVPPGFAAGTPDPATGCPTATRARSQLGANLLAALPLFGPPATIVMGTPESTGRAPPDWLRTILHEHFHQWQAALPDYYPRIAALDLANGDATGIWMLNYAFPYRDAPVVAAHAAASRALAAALALRGRPGFAAAVRRYVAKRRAFAASVSPADWRYAEFQLWQEGTARWTEIALGARYPQAAVRASAAALEQRTLDRLAAPDLAASGREFVYPYGAGEAMLLEACGDDWRRRYVSLLALGPLVERCARRH